MTGVGIGPMAPARESSTAVGMAEGRTVVVTRPYFVTIVRRIPHAIDASDAMRAAEIGAGALVDVEIAEDCPLP